MDNFGSSKASLLANDNKSHVILSEEQHTPSDPDEVTRQVFLLLQDNNFENLCYFEAVELELL